MPPLVLFDLGDTLLYRKESHFDLDASLIELLFHKSADETVSALERVKSSIPGLYEFWLDRVDSLANEEIYLRKSLGEAFKSLGLSEADLVNFLKERNTQKRYHLYPDATNLLSAITSAGFTLGVLTNGRPSRRRVLEQLGIIDYFDPQYLFISDEIGLSKPQEAIFKYINNRVKENKIYLFDDEKKNLTTAKSIGWEVGEVDHRLAGYDVVYNILKLK